MANLNIYAGDGRNIVTDVVVASGQNLKAGDVVKLNGEGKVEKIATGDTPYGVMRGDCDASDTDKTGQMYYGGVSLNENQLDFGDGTADEFREALRGLGIYLVKEF